MALVDVKDLSIGYGTHIIASGISFHVDAGDFLCILGENGSGKSTLIRTLVGLMAPVSGTISFGDGLRADQIGYLGQQTVVQKDFPASVREIVISGCLNSSGHRLFYSASDRERAEQSMRDTGIENLRSRSYRKLSGGQQQRVLLARALCASGRLLLLDEPVTGLDPDASASLYALLRKLNGQGLAIIMVSHDIGASLECASHVLEMKNNPVLMEADAFRSGKGGRG